MEITIDEALQLLGALGVAIGGILAGLRGVVGVLRVLARFTETERDDRALDAVSGYLETAADAVDQKTPRVSIAPPPPAR